MSTAAIKRYWDYVASLPCANCGVEGVQISHYVGVSGGYIGKGASSKAHNLAVAPHCPKCHALADARKLWNMEGHDKFTNQLSHSEGFAIQILQTLIKAHESGVLKI